MLNVKILFFRLTILFYFCSKTASFNYFGKIVLKIRDEESKKVIIPVTKKVLSVRKTFADPEKAYIVIGAYYSFK